MAFNLQERNTRLWRIIGGALVILGIALVAVYAIEGDGGPLHKLQQQVHSMVAPAQSVSANAGAAMDAASDAVADATADEGTLSALKERNEELTRLLTQAEEYRLEAERLHDLLEMKDVYKMEGVTARVIGRSTDAWNQTVTIDAGTEEGVGVGLTVMGPAGVIGQVVEANPSSSVVRLLTDPNSGVASLVQSSRVEGIVRGSLTGALHLENVDESDQVSQGDVILTSGLGGSFVKGLLIGTVVRVEGNANDGTRVIVVAPNEEARSLEEVTVVFSASQSASVIKRATDAQEGDQGQSDGGDEGAAAPTSDDGSQG
ncbi:MAG: rod shape-determining protein MreC [Eggerthellaceae bacterium]|nr:rod shape-determining protein MreC [Eggerthellaceae bacterium]